MEVTIRLKESDHIDMRMIIGSQIIMNRVQDRTSILISFIF